MLLAVGCLALRVPAERAVPALTGRVVDQAGMLGADAMRVENAIHGLEQATGGQMAILTVPTLGNDALESFSMRVAEAWKIGRRGQDNGALLVLVRDSHKIRLEIGYGWEGSINDARAGDIIRSLGPFFRADRFGDGCIHAVGQVQRLVTGKPPTGMPAPPAGAATPGVQGDDDIQIGGVRIDPIWIFVAFIVFFVLIGTLSNRRRGTTYDGRRTYRYGKGWSSGGGGISWSGGGFSSGGSSFSGGGGSFGGGGASGSW